MAKYRSRFDLHGEEISVAGTGNISASHLEKFIRIRIGGDDCIVTMSYDEAAKLMQELHNSMKQSIEQG